MQVSQINDINQFDKLKSTWDSVYIADPHAEIFLSWAWLRGWFETTPNAWLVLAVQSDNSSSYVAFFALAKSVIQKYGFSLLQRLLMGGYPIADYTGFVCLPEHEEQAIKALADYIQQHLQWDIFQISEVLDPRFDLFLQQFPVSKFNVQQIGSMSCPYLPLPSSWEQYLQDFLSSKTRKNLKYCLQRLEKMDEIRLTHVGADNLEEQINTLLELWHSRWRLPGHFVKGYHSIFRRCFENNNLWLSVLWHSETPIAALAALVDHHKRTFSFCITGYNDEFAKLSPGRFILGYSIRYAIENKFQIYDFLRGDEEYKFSLGAKERFNTHTLISRKSLRMSVLNRIALKSWIKKRQNYLLNKV